MLRYKDTSEGGESKPQATHTKFLISIEGRQERVNTMYRNENLRYSTENSYYFRKNTPKTFWISKRFIEEGS